MERKKGNFLSGKGVFLLLLMSASLNAAITDPGNGNPLVPGFFADPFVFYDSGTFYLYPTTDGYDDGTFMYFGPFGVWHSTDFVNWTFKTLLYPADFPWSDNRLWVPSVTRGADGTYYLYYIRSGNTTARYVPITVQSTSLQTNSVFHGTVAAGIWEMKVRKNSQVGLRTPDCIQSIAAGGLRVAANAARGTLRFELQRREGGEAASLAIYTMRGELVQVFRNITRSFLVWDCRDRFGRRARGGVYCVTMEYGQHSPGTTVYVR
jgi:hypothetical protein